MSRSARTSSTSLLIAILVGSLGVLGAALVSQHVYDMQPCAWCVLQRFLFVKIGALALLGLLLRVRPIQVFVGVLGALLALAGIASALWQQLVAAKSSSCNLTLADKIVSGLQLDALMPEVFSARASCAEAAVNLFGIPYAYWSLAAFAVIGVLCLRVARGR